jgi:NTE family protein
VLSAGSLPRPLAFVLGGGGSFGAMQVGMLHALDEAGIVPDLVVGTSIGALNGSIVAARPVGAAARLSRIWVDIDPDEVLGKGLIHRMKPIIGRRNHLYDNDGLRSLAVSLVGNGLIEDLEIPFGAVALEIDNVAPVLFRSGPVVSAILASAAIPGVFAPVERDGHYFYDGGLISTVPILQALEMGAASAVVLDCIWADQQTPIPSNMLDALAFASLVAARSQGTRELPIAAHQIPVIYLPGPAPRLLSPLDFRRTDQLIAEAYDGSLRFLSTLDVNGPGLYREAGRSSR